MKAALATDPLALLSRATVDRAGDGPARFTGAEPFAHCVIDDFLDEAFARRLYSEFPSFDLGDRRNEAGVTGGKATHERIEQLGGSFLELHDGVRSAPFLELVSRITGIPGLLHDPEYFGGGTHENRGGQSLDSHIDFNYHPTRGWHRRLNLIVYLNPEWQPEWGGALELHSDPHDPDQDEVIRIDPVFNRCVVFETTEHSWHGFERIALPPGRDDLGRKSVALYFYTRERPGAEVAANHSTVYVDRPLPSRIQPGRTLTARDHAELQELLTRRDGHIRRLYADIERLQAQLDQSVAGRVFRALRRMVIMNR